MIVTTKSKRFAGKVFKTGLKGKTDVRLIEQILSCQRTWQHINCQPLALSLCIHPSSVFPELLLSFTIVLGHRLNFPMLPRSKKSAYAGLSIWWSAAQLREI